MQSGALILIDDRWDEESYPNSRDAVHNMTVDDMQDSYGLGEETQQVLRNLDPSTVVIISLRKDESLSKMDVINDILNNQIGDLKVLVCGKDAKFEIISKMYHFPFILEAQLKEDKKSKTYLTIYNEAKSTAKHLPLQFNQNEYDQNDQNEYDQNDQNEYDQNDQNEYDQDDQTDNDDRFRDGEQQYEYVPDPKPSQSTSSFSCFQILLVLVLSYFFLNMLMGLEFQHVRINDKIEQIHRQVLLVETCKLGDLEESLHGPDTQISKLHGQVYQLNGMIAELHGQLSDIKSQYNGLSKELTTLKENPPANPTDSSSTGIVNAIPKKNRFTDIVNYCFKVIQDGVTSFITRLIG